MNNLKLILALLAFSVISTAFGQKTQIDCRIIFNQMDNLLEEKDTLGAVRLYEVIDEEKYIIPSYRHLLLSRLYYSLGDSKKSKIQMLKAIESGVMGLTYFKWIEDWLEPEIRNNYGDSFAQEMVSLHQQLIDEKLSKYGHIIYELKDIYEVDQALRKNKKYKACKSYGFRYKLGFPYDTTQNHEEMMALYKIVRQKDSLNLQRFVNIVDSLGYVPGDDIVFNLLPMSVIINHTGHYRFKNLDSLYLHSVHLGTLSPQIYAWTQGYYEEFFQEDFQLYFSHLERYFKTCSEEEIKAINRRRLKIGLPMCPTTVWNSNLD